MPAANPTVNPTTYAGELIVATVEVCAQIARGALKPMVSRHVSYGAAAELGVDVCELAGRLEAPALVLCGIDDLTIADVIEIVEHPDRAGLPQLAGYTIVAADADDDDTCDIVWLSGFDPDGRTIVYEPLMHHPAGHAEHTATVGGPAALERTLMYSQLRAGGVTCDGAAAVTARL